MLEKKRALSILLIAALAAGLYANTLRNAFVYDDEVVVLENKYIRSWKNFPLIFQPGYFRFFSEGTYRPVVTTSYFFDYSLWKLNPAGYHLTNVVLHAVNGVLLFCLLDLLLVAPAAAFLAALFFVCHPVAGEAVNAISFREDLFAFGFYALALLWLVKSDRAAGGGRKHYFLGLAAFLLALFSKETAATLPLALILLDPGLLRRGAPERTKKRLLRFGGIFLVLGTYLFIRFVVFRNPDLPPPDPTILPRRLLTEARIVAHYLRLLVLPLGLSAEYKFRVSRSFLEPAVWSSTLLILGVMASSLLFLRRSRSVFSGIWWFFLTLLPAANIVPLHNPAAERYLYLPLAGFGMALAGGMELLAGTRKKGRAGAAILILAFIFFWSPLIIMRNRTWRDSLTFYRENLKRCPQSSRFHYDLGNIYQRRRQYDEAEAEYLTALRIKPDSADVHNNLGFIYLDRTEYDPAIAEFRIALRINPRFPEARYNLGNAYLGQGRREEAAAEYRQALELKPDYARARNNLGVIYLQRELYEQALVEFQRAVEIDPDLLDARNNLGVTYFILERFEQARKEWEKVLARQPDYPSARTGLEKLKEVERDADKTGR